MSRPDYDPLQEEITKLRLLLNQAESQRDAFKGALHSEVKDIMRRAVSQATYDARYDAEASLKEHDEAENTIAQLKAKLENRDRELAAFKAEVERLEGLVKYWQIEAETDHAHWVRHAETNARLRKAGDAVSICLEAFWKGKPYDTPTIIKCFDGWNAAKDGKQP